MSSLPVVVQHSAGPPGAGGPVMTLERLLASPLADRYRFVRMHTERGNGGVNVPLLREWVSLLRQVRPDLVHVRGLQNEGFHGVLAARLAGCPRIMVTIHGTVRDLRGRSTWQRAVLERGLEPATLRLATHVATVSEAAARRPFLRPYQHKFLGVVPNGVPVPEQPRQGREEVRAELAVPVDATVMITVSRLTWDKGFRTLAGALAQITPRRRRPVLLVVGDGPDRPGIEADLRAVSGVDIRFVGRRLDVDRLLGAADLFLFPTLHENLSVALLEAMAHGLPVVASAVGGNVEVLSRGGGVLIPPEEATAWTKHIDQFLDDPAAGHDLGEEGRRVVARHYTVCNLVTTLDAMYQRVLSE
jgi:glycosyltransferase involved in cell wall biosynthesis